MVDVNPTTLKMTLVGPIPSASVTIAEAANAGLRRKPRASIRVAAEAIQRRSEAFGVRRDVDRTKGRRLQPLRPVGMDPVTQSGRQFRLVRFEYGRARIVEEVAGGKAAPVSDPRELPLVRDALATIGKGGYPEAIALIGALVGKGAGHITPARLELVDQFVRGDDVLSRLPAVEVRRIKSEQAVIAELEPERALESLPKLLADSADRKRALTVLMDLAPADRNGVYVAIQALNAISAIGPHAAPLGMRFYTGKMFPAKYRNAIFLTRHGPWNRTQKYAADVVAVFIDEKGRTKMEPFLTGLVENTQYLGRPADVMVMKDGSLLVSDDHNGAIYRITYRGKN